MKLLFYLLLLSFPSLVIAVPADWDKTLQTREQSAIRTNERLLTLIRNEKNNGKGTGEITKIEESAEQPICTKSKSKEICEQNRYCAWAEYGECYPDKLYNVCSGLCCFTVSFRLNDLYLEQLVISGWSKHLRDIEKAECH